MPDELIIDNPIETDDDVINEGADVEDTTTVEEIEEEDQIEKEEDEEKPESSEDDKVEDEKFEEARKRFPFERPSIDEIKKEFPDFFKKFPIIRDVVFQEIEYRKLYPTIDDAKEAQEDSLALSGLRDSVLQGKTDVILDAITETDPKAAERFSLNFLPTLYAKNQQLYAQTITPMVEQLARNMYRSSDENTRNAGVVLAQWLYPNANTHDLTELVEGKLTFAKSTKETEDERKMREERTSFETQKYEEFRGAVINGTDGMIYGLNSLIIEGLDPKRIMTKTQREMLVDKIRSEVDAQLASDKDHMSIMNARWLRSKKEGFNTVSKDKLVSAYLSRAKQIVPGIREKIKNDFLGTSKKVSESRIKEIDSKSAPTKPIVSGRASSGQGSSRTLSKQSYKGMSDIDIINS